MSRKGRKVRLSDLSPAQRETLKEEARADLLEEMAVGRVLRVLLGDMCPECFDSLSDEEVEDLWVNLEKDGLVKRKGSLVAITNKGWRVGYQLLNPGEPEGALTMLLAGSEATCNFGGRRWR